MKKTQRNITWALSLAIGGFCVWQGWNGQAAWCGEPSKRPADYKPFWYEYTAEQLVGKFSTDQMKRAEAELKEIQTVNEKGPWKPTWESLGRHEAPQWFLDAKLGVMINWGLHLVPAWDKPRGGAVYPDAYGCTMYVDDAVQAHHVQYWGADFQWDDFFPLFKGEAYDFESWVKLLDEAGVRYIIPFSKHHDGIAWWDSAWTKRNTVQMGPKKDLLTPLVASARKRNLKIGMYFCFEEWATAILGADDKPCCRIWNWGIYAGQHPLTLENRRRVSGNIPVKNYYNQYMTPLVKEMVDRFNPDCLWMDGEWATPFTAMQKISLRNSFAASKSIPKSNLNWTVVGSARSTSSVGNTGPPMPMRAGALGPSRAAGRKVGSPQLLR